MNLKKLIFFCILLVEGCTSAIKSSKENDDKIKNTDEQNTLYQMSRLHSSSGFITVKRINRVNNTGIRYVGETLCYLSKNKGNYYSCVKKLRKNINSSLTFKEKKRDSIFSVYESKTLKVVKSSCLYNDDKIYHNFFTSNSRSKSDLLLQLYYPSCLDKQRSIHDTFEIFKAVVNTGFDKSMCVFNENFVYKTEIMIFFNRFIIIPKRFSIFTIVFSDQENFFSKFFKKVSKIIKKGYKKELIEIIFLVNFYD